jgi:hypothetical protein
LNEVQAAKIFSFSGEVVPGVQFAGSRVTVVVRLDPVEVERRNMVGLSAILDRDLCEALAELPADWPVPVAKLDPVTLRIFDRAPPGVVERTPITVTRRWQPALTVTGVLLTSRDWQVGLRTVSVFAPDAPRGLVLTRAPRALEPLRARAKELGIGVLVSDPRGRWRLVVEPHREPSYAPGPRHWRLLETTYLAWRRLVSQPSAVQLLR